MTVRRNVFKDKRGLIISCDVHELNDMRNIVRETCDVIGIAGYKLGAMLATKFGLASIVNEVRAITDLPVLYDHQKFGTDIPDWCFSAVEKVFAPSGIRGLIMFPQSGPETLRSCVKACFEFGVEPIVGGAMTHKAYLSRDGGWIEDSGPSRMYGQAADMGVDHFVIPGNQPERISEYVSTISRLVKFPKFLFPGIGAQGGELGAALGVLGNFSAYAIIGRQIISQSDRHQAALQLCSMIPRID